MDPIKPSYLSSADETGISGSRPPAAVIGLTHWLPLLLWMAFIFGMSTDIGSKDRTHGLIFRTLAILWPGVLQLPPEMRYFLEYGLRKTGHVTEYAILGVLLLRALRQSEAWEKHAPMTALVCVVLYAAIDELHQGTVSSRTSSIGDVGYDALGGLLGIAASWFFIARKRDSLDAPCTTAPASDTIGE